ncbi:hypothetical protein RhiirC2_804260 [Rhizophagus irregularis]|uniref:DUF8211 domain-containing protein n=1 Tax=Rhizophagus irregularis TaxID=588596 RepID=A0A2N1L2A7_9GLOM|nr:hypothetical protein RhiirC2_804260 [Rhizophagus irregularis]
MTKSFMQPVLITDGKWTQIPSPVQRPASVFYNRGNHKKSHRRVDTLEEKLHRARQHRFLFLPSQQINKPIQHLTLQVSYTS